MKQQADSKNPRANRGTAPTARHIIEYALLRGLAATVNRLPLRAALGIGWVHALPAFYLSRFRVAEAKRRIRRTFGERFTEDEVTRIAWTSWRNIIFTCIEMLRMGRMTVEKIQPRAENWRESMATLERHVDSGRGAVVACPHMGNWEIAGLLCHLSGIPIFSIAGRQRNPLVNDYLQRLRGEPGIETIERGSGTMRTVVRRLREGQVLAVLPDVRARDPGIQVPFLGGTANIGPGMAFFARAADVPIFPYIIRRIGWPRLRVEALAPIRPDKTLDKKGDLHRMTASVLGLVEQAIVNEPEQWFWFNKRWILDPLDT